MVTLATDFGSTDADLNIVSIASAIPWLGSAVVGALCLANNLVRIQPLFEEEM
jgi:hypothetical protein